MPPASASANGSIAAAFFGIVQREMGNVTPATRRALQELMGYIFLTGQQLPALGAASEAIPAARAMLRSTMSEPGGMARLISPLTEVLRPLVEARLADEAMEQVVAFLRVALADNAVIAMLRTLASAELLGDDRESDFNMAASMDKLAEGKMDTSRSAARIAKVTEDVAMSLRCRKSSLPPR